MVIKLLCFSTKYAGSVTGGWYYLESRRVEIKPLGNEKIPSRNIWESHKLGKTRLTPKIIVLVCH